MILWTNEIFIGLFPCYYFRLGELLSHLHEEWDGGLDVVPQWDVSLIQSRALILVLQYQGCSSRGLLCERRSGVIILRPPNHGEVRGFASLASSNCADTRVWVMNVLMKSALNYSRRKIKNNNFSTFSTQDSGWKKKILFVIFKSYYAPSAVSNHLTSSVVVKHVLFDQIFTQ